MLQIIKIKQERYISKYYIYIFLIYSEREYICKFCIGRASVLSCTSSNENFSKFWSVQKFLSLLDIYSLFHSILYSLWSIYNYNFLNFIQSHNTYFSHHMRKISTTLITSEYHFIGVYRSNPLISNLMSLYEISSYVDIASISKASPTTKRQIVAIYLFRLFGIYIPILLKSLPPQVLNY